MARVSSKEQATNSHSLSNQIERLVGFGCEKIYADVGSGFKTDTIRTNFDQLMLDVEAGDEVVVTNLDRLSRNEVVSFMVFDSFEEKNVRLISMDQPYLDLSNPDLRLLAGYSVLEARAYSARLSQRIKRGHQARRDRAGAYRPCFGYKVESEKYCLNNDLCPDLPDNYQGMTIAAVARDLIEIFLLKQSLRSTLREINRKYGVRQPGRKRSYGIPQFSGGAFAYWLTNPILRGHTCYGRGSIHQSRKRSHLWDMRHSTHAPIMSELEYREVEEILDKNENLRGYGCKESNTIHPLSGIVSCGECDGRCRVILSRLRSDKNQKIYYYQCLNYHMGKCIAKKCVRHEAIYEAVNRELTMRHGAIAQLAQIPDEYVEPPELQKLRSSLVGLEELGDNPAIIAAKLDLQRQIDEYSHQLRVKDEHVIDNIELLSQHFGDPIFWSTLLPEEKKLVYRRLIEKVTIKNGVVEQVVCKV